MSIGKQSDFVIYQPQFYGGLIEALEQNADAFNGSSQNAIRLVPSRKTGEFEKESFFKAISSSLITRRDLTSVSGVTDQKLEQGEIVRVKVNRKIGPVAQTLNSFEKIGEDPQTFSYILGKQTGERLAIDYINVGLAALVGAIGNVAALVYDGTGDTPATMNHLKFVRGMRKFGDKAERIRAWVMHSTQWFDLMENAIADKLFEVAGVTIYAGTTATFNRPTIVLDSPSLINTTPTPDAYYVLGLTENACVIEESEQRNIVSQVVTGLEQLVIRIQGEYAFNIGLKGYSWDVTNGGSNPTDTALATGSNWDQWVADVKATAGVMMKVN
jgi:hypothetical protein